MCAESARGMADGGALDESFGRTFVLGELDASTRRDEALLSNLHFKSDFLTARHGVWTRLSRSDSDS
jgi:hypothetical protein